MMKHVLPGKSEKQQVWRALAFLCALLLLCSLSMFLFTSTVSAASSHPTAFSRNHVSQWMPTGKFWRLTITFVPLSGDFQGSRQGQVEVSLMTFRPGGKLTATFPGSSSGSPPTLPPAIDGTWLMTGPNAFHYQFKDPIFTGSTMVAYIQVQVDASLLSPTTYVAGGVGIAYAVATDRPLPGQYNVTSTVAIAA